MEFNLEEEIKKLPEKPGVYIMHNISDEIIYVGKAVVLKNRVRQYFRENKQHTPKVKKMVSQVAWFEYIVVSSEAEALILECNLIKEHRPKYNTMLKDDKHYPYIRITTNEPYPRIMMARERKKDSARYFGPYTSADAVRDTIDLLRKIYDIRSCSTAMRGEKVNDRPCLYHSMGRCPAPCQGNVNPKVYAESVEKCVNFLNGHYDEVISGLRENMMKLSDEMEFERAAEVRDLITSVMKLDQAQKADECDNNDRDVLGVFKGATSAVVSCFFIREGKLLGRDNFHLTHVENDTDAEIMISFINQYYSGTPHVPKEIFISTELPEGEIETIEGFLSELRGHKVVIYTPQKGEKKRLIEMAVENARMTFDHDDLKLKRAEDRTTGALREIKDLLNLKELYRIESFDISNTQGFENVASMVVFEGGRPKKSDYRRFKTRTIVGADDYGSMREVLTRRFEHGLREKEKQEVNGNDSFVRFPDLLLIDGGRGQVNSVLEVMHTLGLNIPVCGMVKDDRHRTRGLWYHDTEVPIDTTSEGFHLVTRIQDETHRFAITYHRNLRGKAQTHSILDDIPGIGEKRRIELMRHYDSLQELREASVEELSDIPGMNQAAAENIKKFLEEHK